MPKYERTMGNNALSQEKVKKKSPIKHLKVLSLSSLTAEQCPFMCDPLVTFTPRQK